jgi:peptidoglycan/LPS O-acetylase OafA/YrhL
MASSPALSTDAVRHIHGLDSIRFICAAVVAVGHFSLVLDFTPLGLSENVSKILNGIFGLPWNGPAAVIVFFVISGFVIHLPRTNGVHIPVAEYYARRLIRIILPTAAFVILHLFYLGPPPHGDWNKTILWSVICELIYYLIYPLLLASGIRIQHWLLLSCVGFAILIGVYWETLLVDLNYPVFGYAGTWIAGFPAWLAGCWLAENWRRFAVSRTSTIWLLRAIAIAIPAALQMLRFQVPALAPWNSYAITLTLYVPFIVYWLGKEIRHHQDRQTAPRLDVLGVATFSIYLVHWFVVESIPAADRGAAMMIVYLVGVAVASWLFYILIERPSHQMARTIGRKFSRRETRQAAG